jgi:hypothetical protein
MQEVFLVLNNTMVSSVCEGGFAINLDATANTSRLQLGIIENRDNNLCENDSEPLLSYGYYVRDFFCQDTQVTCPKHLMVSFVVSLPPL